MAQVRKKPRAVHILESIETFGSLLARSWTPYVDMAEQDNLLLIKVELPGVLLEDISVTLRSNVVTLEGIKKEGEISPTYACYYCVERVYGKFRREIGLPFLVHIDQAKATLADGILEITLKRMEDRRGQSYHVPIQKVETSRKL